MWLLCGVQGVAESFSVRVTFFSGDVHVGAFGCFQAHPKQPIRVADPKFMLQVRARQHGNKGPGGFDSGNLKNLMMSEAAWPRA